MSILDAGGITVPDSVRTVAILGFVALGALKKISIPVALAGAAASWFFLLPGGTVTPGPLTTCGTCQT